MDICIINLREWKLREPEKGGELYNRFINTDEDRQLVDLLNKKGILSITELKTGLSISANSYVGRIRIGDIQINVLPKIKGVPLYKLLKYTYGLRDLEILSEAMHGVNEPDFFDLLIYQLCAEVEELITRGLNKRYVNVSDKLSSPRGRINFKQLLKNGGMIGSTLPCEYHRRLENNIFNQVLLAGLILGGSLTQDSQLKIKLNRLINLMREGVSKISLTSDTLITTYSKNKIVSNFIP